MKRQINQAAIDLIKSFEGCELKAYPDPATGAEPYTIGYGHTEGVKPGDTITLEEAEALLVKDLASFCQIVTDAVKVPISDNQFGALVSFTYNCGPKNLRSSTLLRLLNEGKYQLAKAEFARWNKAAGKVMAGLTRRRAAEAELFGKEPTCL